MNIASAKDLKIVRGLPPVAKKGDRVSIDSEFFGQEKRRLHRPHGRFAFLGASYDGITVYYITDTDEIQEFYNRIDAATHVYHHAKYDIRQLREYANIPNRKLLWDTMLVEQIQWSGYYTDFSLADLVRRYLDTYLPKDVRSEFSVDTESMSKEQIEYSCVDVAYTWRVFRAQREKICDDDLAIWKDIELPFMWTLLSMSGVKMDVEKWSALAEKNGKIAKEIQDKYGHWEETIVERQATVVLTSEDDDDGVGVFLPYKKTKKPKFIGINLNSPAQVKAHLQSLGYRVSTTGADFLDTISDECDFAKDMCVYRTYSKRASTYGLKFIEDYVEPDGKIYADIHQIGAECMPQGELVLTNRGYLPVEDVKVGDSVITHRGREKKVTGCSFHDASNIVRVSLHNGLSLRTTSHHPYLVFRDGVYEWENAMNLRYGDVVVYYNNPEVWKPIQDWEDYLISSWGRVVNSKTNKILALQRKGKWGHLKITLVRNGARHRGDDRKDFAVHILVANAFVAGRDDVRNEVRHLNGFAWDNYYENLCWGTSKENRQDAVQHGTMSHRYPSSQAKFTDEMVREIRDTSEYRGKDRVLSEKWNVSREMVRDIRLGKRWPDDYFNGKGKRVEFDLSMVERVILDGKECTYGLEIEEDHSHITGGIVTHNTGRTSCRAPNLQNQPHEVEYRECFIVDEDECMIVADWGSQEPRIAAYLSGDDGLKEALNSDEKLYVRVARDVLNISITKSDEEYKHMKSTVLGIFYGMSAQGLSEAIGVSEEVAQQYINSFLETYPGVEGYMERQKQAKEFVTSIYGRKIWLNKYSFQWERNALNAPIQSSAADAMKIASSRFTQETIHHGWKLVLLVHDEIAIVTPKVECEFAMKILAEAMVDVAEEMHDGIKGSVDVFSGSNWACKS